LTEAFCRPPITKRGKGAILPHDGLNPRIGLPYTYLMSWFTLHCPTIIQAGEEPPEGVRVAHLRRFEGSSWSRIYVAAVRKLLCWYDVDSLFWRFPYICDAGYGDKFKDVRDSKTSSSRGVFEWLISTDFLNWYTGAEIPAIWSHTSPVG